MKTKDLFASNQETSVYFWTRSDSNGITYQFSTHPHPLLPHHCAEHRWWSDRPCDIEHERQLSLFGRSAA